jgi:hypothetical protein
MLNEKIIQESDKFMYNLRNLRFRRNPGLNSSACFHILETNTCTALNGPHFHFRPEMMFLRGSFYRSTAPQNTYEKKLKKTYEVVSMYIYDTMRIFNERLTDIKIVIGVEEYTFNDVECRLKKELIKYLFALGKIFEESNAENEELENMKQEILLTLNTNIYKFSTQVDSLLSTKYDNYQNKSDMIKNDECLETSPYRLNYNSDNSQQSFVTILQLNNMTGENNEPSSMRLIQTDQKASISVENSKSFQIFLGISTVFGLCILMLVIHWIVSSIKKKRKSKEKEMLYQVCYEEKHHEY